MGKARLRAGGGQGRRQAGCRAYPCREGRCRRCCYCQAGPLLLLPQCLPAAAQSNVAQAVVAGGAGAAAGGAGREVVWGGQLLLLLPGGPPAAATAGAGGAATGLHVSRSSRGWAMLLPLLPPPPLAKQEPEKGGWYCLGVGGWRLVVCGWRWCPREGAQTHPITSHTHHSPYPMYPPRCILGTHQAPYTGCSTTHPYLHRL